MRAAVCALAGIELALRCVRLLTAAIRWRAASLPIGVRFSAGNPGRLRSEKTVLLGAAASLTGVVIEAAPQARSWRRWPR